jgi:GTPase SAR1 family protein
VVRKSLDQLIRNEFLGTKIDLREDREFVNQLQKQNIQPIKREQGQRLCKKIRAFKYVECSALTQKGLKQVYNPYSFSLSIFSFSFQVFDDAVRAVLSPKTSKVSKSSCIFL